MLELVQNTIARYHMLMPAQRVLIALSGGMDSVALLFVLKELGYEVCACHFEHGLRGPSSLEDMRFVQRLCQREKVELYFEQGDVPAYMRQMGLSCEAAARALRYDFFTRAMARLKAERCATAHHLDDQAETLLMRLARGALDGLNGIPYVNGPFIRPLRDVTRAQIERYVQEKSLPFAQDATNWDPAIARNRVRLEVLPALQAVNSAAVRNLAQSIACLMQDAACLERMAQETPIRPGLEIQRVAELDEPIRRRVIYRFLKDAGARQPGRKQLALVSAFLGARNGERLDLEGVGLIRDGRYIRKVKDIAPMEPRMLTIGGMTRFGDGILKVSVEAAPVNPVTSPDEQYLDADKLNGPLWVRQRRAGDRVAVFGGNGEKKLKELFNDHDVAADLRDGFPVIEDGNNILWVAGLCASRLAAVDARTQKTYHLQYIMDQMEGKS